MAKIIILLVLSFAVAVFGQTGFFQFGGFNNEVVGVQSTVYTINLNVAPNVSVQLTPLATGASFSPQFLFYDQFSTSATFKVTPTITGFITVTFTVGGTNAIDYQTPGDELLFSNIRTFSTSWNFLMQIGLGMTTPELRFSLPSGQAPPNRVTLTPTITPSNGGLTINPASLTIINPADSASFTLTAVTQGNYQLDWTVGDVDIDLFSTPGSTLITVIGRQISGPILPTTQWVNTTSTPLYMRLPSALAGIDHSSITVRMSAVDVVFDPNPVSFANDPAKTTLASE